MPVNVEIKARCREPERQAQLAAALSARSAAHLQQTDTYFITPHGRLKLREATDGASAAAELIFYQRADQLDPKVSDYQCVPVTDAAALRVALAAALEVRGVVRKTRRVYLAGQTRIHLDAVDGLGAFIELEVVLTERQTSDAGRAIAADIMARLDIHPDDLIAASYIDLLAGGAR
jgi:predicted adenylyl cyclase CyaB